MESGSAGVSRVGQIVSLIFAAFVLVTAAGAQQPASATQLGQSIPAELPAAQTVEQAAKSASGAQATTPDTAKDSADQSNSVRLGPGDLVEVNVYNVPELASKVRVSNSGDVYLPLIDYVHVDGLTLEGPAGV